MECLCVCGCIEVLWVWFEFILFVLSVLGECGCVWDLLDVFESFWGVLSAFGCVRGVFCGDVRVLDVFGLVLWVVLGCCCL